MPEIDSTPAGFATPRTRDDLLTLAALGMLAYIGCDLGHELIGHGGVCLATGGRTASFSTVHFQCMGGWQPLITAAGILFNIATGTLLWLALRRLPVTSADTRQFLWLSMGYNLLTGWGYLIRSSLSNSGDWSNFLNLEGVPPESRWRLAVALAGVLFYAWSVRVLTIELRSFAGDREIGRAWQIVLIPYGVAALVPCAVIAVNSHLTVGLALNVFLGSLISAWGFLLPPVLLLVRRKPATQLAPTPRITRSFGWMLSAGVAVIVFVWLIGPGVRLNVPGQH
jgi:hypothetical protein